MKFVSIEKVSIKRGEEIVFVGSLSAIDEQDSREELKAIPEDAADRERRLMKAFLRRYVALEDRSKRFQSDDATVEFLSTHTTREVWQVIEAGQKLNALSDDAIKEELKN